MMVHFEVIIDYVLEEEPLGTRGKLKNAVFSLPESEVGKDISSRQSKL